MAGLIEDLVSGVMKSAVSEILKKSRSTTTRRVKRRSKKAAGGGLLEAIIDAALRKPEMAPRKPARKQVSRRRSAAARSPQRGS